MGGPEGGNLKIYVDCGMCLRELVCMGDLHGQFYSQDIQVSPYSWFGFTNVIKHRPFLNKHGVSVEIIPFFLGGAREGAGNKFEPTPKWKEAFAAQDSELTGELLGLKVVRPEIFPIFSLFVSCPFFKSNDSRSSNNRITACANCDMDQRSLSRREV